MLARRRNTFVPRANYRPDYHHALRVAGITYNPEDNFLQKEEVRAQIHPTRPGSTGHVAPLGAGGFHVQPTSRSE